MHKTINDMQANGDTNTGEAFKRAKTLLDSSKNDRPTAKRVLVLFTDGAPAPKYYDVHYGYSKNATVQARNIRNAHPDLHMYCVYWNPNVGDGEEFILGEDIPISDVEYINRKPVEKTWGKTLSLKDRFILSDYWYLRINNNFILNTLLPTFVSNPSYLIEASTDPTGLEQVFDGISGKILSFATEVQLEDVVEDEYFSTNINNGSDIQFRKAVTTGSNENIWTNISNDPAQPVHYTVSDNTITLYFDEISQPGIEVRFRIKLKDGVCSSKDASEDKPDLDTNESANISFKDALETEHKNINIPIYPKVYVPGYTVEFKAGENGRLTGTTKYENILTGTSWSEAIKEVPKPEPNPGYTFKGWTSEFAGTITQDLEYTAIFEKDTKQWHTVIFKAGENGSIMDGYETVFTEILDGTLWSEAVTVPETVADPGYKFKDWTPEFPEKVTESKTYTANFREDYEAKIRIPVSKYWIDDAESNNRPESIELYLVDENGKKVDSITLTDNEGYWEGYFEVPKYDKNNNEIDYSRYTVVEEDLDDYISLVEMWSVSDGFGLYNIEAIRVPVIKEWEGPSGEIKVELLDNGEPTGYKLTLNKDNKWQDYFKLPKYDIDENEIDYSGYTIKELEVEGYTPVITGSVYEGFNIVNKLKEVTYIINYLDYETNSKLAPSVFKSGSYFETVTEKAIDIDGYNKIGNTTKTITLGSSKNEINFYYAKQEVIEGSDYHEVAWKYETGYNTKEYNTRYELSGKGKPGAVQYYVDLHYDSGYTFTNYKTWTEEKGIEVIFDVTTGSAITGSAITGTAIKIETTTFIELFYNKDAEVPEGPGEPGESESGEDDEPGGQTPSGPRGGGGTIIEEPEVPLADLERVDHFAYIIGYPEGDVRPLNTITREEVAMIFYRLLTDESREEYLSDENPFIDVESDRWSNRAISTLYNAGIISGYPDGTFRPTAPITRAEFATIAAKFDNLDLGNPSKFIDIAGHWAKDYITSSENKGWIKGYPDMTFKPEQDITRAEAMTLINNVLGRIVLTENIHPDAIFWQDNPRDAWYFTAVMEATNSHEYTYNEVGEEVWTGMKPNKLWP